ncbi:MAG: molybdate ABC transporter permease subunit [Alphaproteobacteria bacterium]
MLTAEEISALLLSLRVAMVALVFSLPFAVAIAYVLARKNFPGKIVIDGVIHLPLVLPPVATGFALLLVLGRKGPLGSFLYDTFHITVAFRWTGAAVAAAVMAFPLIVRPIRLAFEAIDPRLEDAAATLGARPLFVFLTVTLPLAVPGLLSAMVLGFAKCLGEFGATITFVSNIPSETRTLPLALYTYIQVPGGEGPAVRLAVIAVVISLGALIIAEVLAVRAKRRLRGPALQSLPNPPPNPPSSSSQVAP